MVKIRGCNTVGVLVVLVLVPLLVFLVRAWSWDGVSQERDCRRNVKRRNWKNKYQVE